MKLTPQQKILFSKWLQQEADSLAMKIDNTREKMKQTSEVSLYKEILCDSSGINSLMMVKFILENN